MPSSDYKVEIVDSSGDADMTVAIVGDQVVNIAGASDGDLLGIHPSGVAVARSLAAWGIQPLDADLTAIAALSTTAYGRALLALADAAAARTALGLGSAALSAASDFQPADADLTAIAALSTTTFGRSLLAIADAAAMRVAAGTDKPVPPLYQLGSGNYATGTQHTPGATSNLVTQAMRLRYFTARSATPINSLATWVTVVGSVDASVARLGIWSLAANGVDLSALLASSAHDPAMWRTLNRRTVALTSAFTPVVGTRYAVGALVVQASGTLPSLLCVTGLAIDPYIDVPANTQLSGQTDLPASSVGAMVGAGSGPWVELIP